MLWSFSGRNSATNNLGMSSEIEQLKAEIESIKARNRRVEADKAWETSKTRNAFIALSSFILIYMVMRMVGADHPFFNAFVSAIAYFLSTLSYGILKKWWLGRKR